jgi:transmembrane sensor
MPDPSRASSDFEPIETAAAAWVVRLAEGLKPDEEADLAAWLAADPRHEAALAEFQRGWDRFAPVAATPPGPNATVVPGVFPRRRALRYAAFAVAAAAAVALGLNLARLPAPHVSTRPPLLPLCDERRVELVRGEAHFTVIKNPARPFIVTAGGVQVRAVGTAFNVRLDAVAVEVVVTEGSVRVNPPVTAAVGEELPMLHAGDHTAVPLAPVAAAALPVVVALAPDALAARLAWQPRLLEFDDVPLSEIVAEFKRRARGPAPDGHGAVRQYGRFCAAHGIELRRARRTAWHRRDRVASRVNDLSRRWTLGCACSQPPLSALLRRAGPARKVRPAPDSLNSFR